MKWLESGQIQIELPKKCKKITGTRLGAILGVNPFQTPFQAWCEITKTYQEPFEDSIYTVAGKTLEAKQRAFIADHDFVIGMKSPEDIFGPDPFKATYGDFYKDEPIFGGMWDSLEYNLSANLPERVFEYKTTKRSEDWLDKTPIYYQLQASLYTYLLHIDDYSMVCTFLEDKDYPKELGNGKFDTTPTENLVISDENTIRRDFANSVDKFKIGNEELTIGECVERAREWWETYVVTGISPKFDEVKDKAILAELRKNNVNPTDDVNSLVTEYENLSKDVSVIELAIKPKQDRMKVIEDKLKETMQGQLREGDKQVSIKGTSIEFVLSKSSTTTIDKDAMKTDGILERYQTSKDSLRLTKKEIKGNK